MYRDRDGNPIDLYAWGKLSADPEYRFVSRDGVAEYDLEAGCHKSGYSWFVITIWIGFDPYNPDESVPPNIFETTVFRRVPGVDGIRLEENGDREWQVDERYEKRMYRTILDAMRGHFALLDQIRMNVAQEAMRAYERSKGMA